MKQLIKNTIESLRRLGMKDDIFSFRYNTKKIYFYLPWKRDYIQQQILFRNSFYERKTLEKISKFVSDDFIFLDIGSNIGNHVVYFTKILNAKKVYSFEPQKDVFEVLERNIEINNIKDRVQLFNIGIGCNNMNAVIDNIPDNNSGATSIKISKNGSIKMNSIDGLNINDKIDFIKIDTEGFEKQVIMGASNLIKNNLPIIWVEISDNKDFIFRYLKDLGYNKPIKLDDYGNYLFVNNSYKK